MSATAAHTAISKTMTRALTTEELRAAKSGRADFRARARHPVTVVLDGVRQGYNVGALFRLCDAMLVEKLLICGRTAETGRRKLVQAAAGTQRWVPHEWGQSAASVLGELRAAGYQVVAVEQAAQAIAPEQLLPRFPLCLVIGAERVAIPMQGMANSLNVATAAAIVLHHVVLGLPTR